MDALFVLALFLVLACLAPRWGYDSRDSAASKEKELASHGVSWADR